MLPLQDSLRITKPITDENGHNRSLLTFRHAYCKAEWHRGVVVFTFLLTHHVLERAIITREGGGRRGVSWGKGGEGGIALENGRISRRKFVLLLFCKCLKNKMAVL